MKCQCTALLTIGQNVRIKTNVPEYSWDELNGAKIQVTCNRDEWHELVGSHWYRAGGVSVEWVVPGDSVS